MARTKLGELLKTKGLISERQINIALAQQRITGDLLGNIIIKLGFVSSSEVGKVLAEQVGLEFFDINEYAISEEALKLVPKDVAEKAGFIPLALDNGTLHIGISNPNNISAIDIVRRFTQKPPRIYVVDGAILNDVIDRAYFFLENPIQKGIDEIVRKVKSQGAADGLSITRLVDLIIMDAIRRHATDIHINPQADVLHCLYRIDGVLQYGHCLPKAVQNGFISRIKVLSQLDIAEQRLPQDGSFSYTALKKQYDMRVSTVPSIYGENVVIRVLMGISLLPDLLSLGFSASDIKKIRTLFKKPYGTILLAGPTGCGKTTTLYAALREVNLLEKNVLTIEDPVEYKLSFVKQSQVNEKAGYCFSLAGRNFLRQDPDVILLGEIRDEETAQIAIRASITGHLVLSTLHTNDAITAIPRLLDLNVDRFLLSSALLSVIAQRLVRKICRFCKTKYQLGDEEVKIFREFGIDVRSAFLGKGCPRCNGQGYAGRTAVGEIFIVDDEIRELITSSAPINVIKAVAIKKGMTLLKADALRKVEEGITSLEEVLRVAG